MGFTCGHAALCWQNTFGRIVFDLPVLGLSRWAWSIKNALRWLSVGDITGFSMSCQELHMLARRGNHLLFSEGNAVGRRYRAAGNSGCKNWSFSRVNGSRRSAPGNLSSFKLQSQSSAVSWPRLSCGILCLRFWMCLCTFRSSRTCKRRATWIKSAVRYGYVLQPTLFCRISSSLRDIKLEGDCYLLSCKWEHTSSVVRSWDLPVHSQFWGLVWQEKSSPGGHCLHLFSYVTDVQAGRIVISDARVNLGPVEWQIFRSTTPCSDCPGCGRSVCQ